MSWIKIGFLKDLLIICFVSMLLLSIVNFFFVYYSPSVIKLVPFNVVRSISPCYRTLFHRGEESLKRVNYVFGDSFSEGAGDELLDEDDEYGIFNKLEDSGITELVFGRGGYGNIGTYVEFEQCYPLISRYTTFDISEIDNYRVLLVFYAGNDLNNNLVEKEREVNELIYKLRFFLPLYEFAYREVRHFASIIYQKITNKAPLSDVPSGNKLPVSSSGIELQLYPQSAATELTITELKDSLSVVTSVLDKVHDRLPAAENYMMLYLPAVASSYSFDDEIRVQSYSGNAFFSTTADFNLQRHQTILNELRQTTSNIGWFLCDTTPKLLAQTDQGIAVHGPRDWKHFNKIGYGIVANAYEECLRMMRAD